MLLHSVTAVIGSAQLHLDTAAAGSHHQAPPNSTRVSPNYQQHLCTTLWHQHAWCCSLPALLGWQATGPI